MDALLKSSAGQNVQIPNPYKELYGEGPPRPLSPEEQASEPSRLPPIADMLRRQKLETMVPDTMGGYGQMMGGLEAAQKVVPDVIQAGAGTSLLNKGETEPFYTTPFKPTEPREIKPWQTPEGNIVNIPNNEPPPPGSVPYSKPGTPPVPRALKSWKTSQGSVIHLPNNELPPPGSVPYESTKIPTTKEERSTTQRIAALPKIKELDPNDAYGRGWKMNDDGTVFTQLDTGAPVRLPDFDQKMGKRGMIRAVLEAGEQLDDAGKVWDLLQAPEVASTLRAAADAGFWDLAYGTWSNKIGEWLQRKGIAKNSKTTEAIIRMGRLASVDRKLFLGTAVSVSELKSIQTWIPAPGDSYDLMVSKIKVAVAEGKEVFNRFLDTYKDTANMSPFYKAFGISRFESGGDLKNLSNEELLKRLGK